MKQITKTFFALAVIISLASCQSSKIGCYDFGAAHSKAEQADSYNLENESKLVLTKVVCQP